MTHALREQDDNAILDMHTDISLIHHPVAQQVMKCLQELWRKRRGTTPHALLSEAIELLRMVPSIAGRQPDQQARALGNLGLLLERARSYDVRGLKQLAVDLAAEWQSEAPIDEAPSDYQGKSIDIVTVHKAKGLEWPIVIPINFVTMPEQDEDFFFGSTDNSAHWTLGDVVRALWTRPSRRIEPRRPTNGSDFCTSPAHAPWTYSSCPHLPGLRTVDGRNSSIWVRRRSTRSSIRLPGHQRRPPIPL